MKFTFEDLKWGLSKKQDGPMNVYLPKINPVNDANRRRYFADFGIDISDVVTASLVHGNHVQVVSHADGGQIIPAADGLVTNELNLFLNLSVADCVPIFFFDPKRRVIGIAHSGWRGTVKNIAGEVLKVMSTQFGVVPTDIFVYIGPHIQKCHFEIGDDIVTQFDDKFVTRGVDVIKVNLAAMIVEQLITSGVKPEKIEVSHECTYCQTDNRFSYRRDKPQDVQGMAAYIGMTK